MKIELSSIDRGELFKLGITVPDKLKDVKSSVIDEGQYIGIYTSARIAYTEKSYLRSDKLKYDATILEIIKMFATQIEKLNEINI